MMPVLRRPSTIMRFDFRRGFYEFTFDPFHHMSVIVVVVLLPSNGFCKDVGNKLALVTGCERTSLDSQLKATIKTERNLPRCNTRCPADQYRLSCCEASQCTFSHVAPWPMAAGRFGPKVPTVKCQNQQCCESQATVGGVGNCLWWIWRSRKLGVCLH